jgi:hypothetical protein
MPAKRPYLYAAALWLAMVTVFFSPVIFQGKVIAPLDIMESLLRPWATTEKIEVHNAFTYDAISQYLPYDYSVYQSLRQDGYIGWNPYSHSGSSIVENTMICPGDWHHYLYRFLPFWSAWNAGIILQFSIAGLGMLFLLRDQKIPAAYALLGVVAFGFYSQFILWIQHRWVLGAMCWAPWILWALFRAKKSRRIIDLPSIAFIALAFRGGHLQACRLVEATRQVGSRRHFPPNPALCGIRHFRSHSLTGRIYRDHSAVSPWLPEPSWSLMARNSNGSSFLSYLYHPHFARHAGRP